MALKTELLAAIEEQNSSSVFKILKSGQINFQSDDYKEDHPLFKAVEVGNVSIVRLLIEYGASYKCTDENFGGGITAFDLAVNHDQKEIVDYFLTLAPSEEEVVNALGGVMHNQEIFDSLLNRITDINRKYGDLGHTVLMAVAESTDFLDETPKVGINRIRRLLEMGANKEITDSKGRKAYDWAKNPDVKNLLSTTQREIPVPVATNQINRRQEDSRSQYAPQLSTQVDKLGCLLGGVCFLIPLIGLVLFLVWKQTFPGKAKSAGIWALVGFGLSVLYWIAVL